MLQLIRDRAHGFLAWVVVVLISVPFALWGIQQYFGSDPNVPVATVNGQEIPLAEFQRAYQTRRANLQALLGASLDPNLLDEARIKQETLRQLVEDEVIVQSGTEAGLRISDEQLARAIRDHSAFQVDGAFSQDAYDQWLLRNGLSPGRFEYLLRRSLLADQLRAAIAGSAIATTHDSSRMHGLLTQRRGFVELAIPVERFLDVAVLEQAVSDYYDAHRAQLVTGEQLQIAYLLLSRDAIGRTIDATEEELRQLYDAHKENYAVSEQRRARHILVRVDDRRDEQAAREAIDALRRRLDAGEPFEALAASESDDPGSATRGGDLGFFARGIMDPAFEEAAFALAENEVSEPVRTPFGYHLVQVTDIRPGATKSYESVREDLLQDFRRQRSEDLYFEQAERLASLAFEHPDTLEVAAEALGLAIQKSDFFSQKGVPADALLGIPEVVNAAFSEDVLRDGNNSAAIELDGDRIVVLRVQEHREAVQLELPAVRAEITALLRRERARERARAYGEALLERLRRGEDPETLAAEAGLAWSRQQTLTRNAEGAPADTLRTVFRMTAPAAGGATYDGVVASGGDFTIIQLRSVEDGAVEDRNALRTTRLALAQESGRALYDTVLQTLRERANVVLFQDRL